MSGYGQFCPVAKAMEVLDERWTMLVVRELILGSTRFNELRRGNPRMSPALLSKRLRTLEQVGRRPPGDGRRARVVHPDPGGPGARDRDARLGAWGTRWIGELGDGRPRPAPADVGHPAHRAGGRVAADAHGRGVPVRRRARPARGAGGWWSPTGDVDVCDFDPGYEQAGDRAHQPADADRDLARRPHLGAARSATGRSSIDGPTDVRRAVPGWFGQGMFADGRALMAA